MLYDGPLFGPLRGCPILLLCHKDRKGAKFPKCHIFIFLRHRGEKLSNSRFVVFLPLSTQGEVAQFARFGPRNCIAAFIECSGVKSKFETDLLYRRSAFLSLCIPPILPVARRRCLYGERTVLLLPVVVPPVVLLLPYGLPVGSPPVVAISLVASFSFTISPFRPLSFLCPSSSELMPRRIARPRSRGGLLL